jgi:type I restriction enzyme R subunit
VKQLKDDSVPLIVTTIQKLNKAVSSLEREISHLKDEKIVFIFDECHRSQFGATHKRITEFFSNTQLFGFTGTPIFAENSSSNEHGKRTTADLFEKCLHKYLIVDAIEDRNVLPFKIDYVGKYEDKTNSNTFVDMEVQGIDIAELMNSDERMEKIKQYVIDRHGIYTRMTEYTSVFACSSIDNLCKYYEMFRADEQRQKMGLKIAAVFSFGANDEFKDDDGSGNARQNSERLDEYVKDYNKTFGTSFKLREQFGFDRYNRDVSKRVKSGNIDILFVVNMYLTGFDSKKLNTLYVDKNLRHHGLIQAFSRTNRVQTNRKPFGNIVCFRNIKNEVDEAVALFSNKAPNESVFLPDYSVLLEQFRAALQRLREVTPTVQSVDGLKGMKAKEEFIKAFRSVLRKHNVLSNDTDFKYDDVDISEQELADYGSKYRDLQPTVKLYKEEAVKESILGEIDFEIELLGTTKLDVDYIIELLGKMVGSDVESKEKLKEKLLRQITNDIKQHSKRELIQRFIEEQLVHIDNPMSIADALEDFFADEREKALFKLSTEYAIQPEELSEVIDKYVWLGQDVPKDEMTDLLKGKHSYMQTRKLSSALSEAVNEYAELYHHNW